MPNAARKTDTHTCPSEEPGPVPHVGGPIESGCSPNVEIEFLPAARGAKDSSGDYAKCEAGGPDYIAQGAETVLINGKYATRVGDMTEHAGVITGSAGRVEIGGATITFRTIQRRTASISAKDAASKSESNPVDSEEPGADGQQDGDGAASGNDVPMRGTNVFPRALIAEVPIPVADRPAAGNGSRRFRCVSLGDRNRPDEPRSTRIVKREWDAHGVVSVPLTAIKSSESPDLEVQIDGPQFLLHQRTPITLSLRVTNEYDNSDQTSTSIVTKHAIAIIDGTGPYSDEAYKVAMRQSFCTQLRGSLSHYQRGPSGEGFGVGSRAQAAADFLAEQHGLRRVLAGYSRGGSAAVIAAGMLKRRGLDVDLLLLFDPVDRHPGGSSTIPSNVARAWIARRIPSAPEMNRYDCSLAGSLTERLAGHNPVRQWFGMTATQFDPATTSEKFFLGSHGALGGVGWPHVREDPGCQQAVASHMNEGLASVGLDIALVSLAPAPDPPLTVEYWDRFLSLFSAFRDEYPVKLPFLTGSVLDRAIAEFDSWLADHGVTDRLERKAMLESFNCKVGFRGGVGNLISSLL